MKLIAQSENIEKFFANNYIYIDKTEYIYNLTKNYERVFFSRPRRFGKSLTLNTIGTLFEKGVDPYFKGTWIYDKWDQHKYPVLHLSFLKYSTSDLTEFKRQLCLSIEKFARNQKIEDIIDDKEPNVFIGNLFDAMSDDQQLVILIDEYDCQLTANINNPDLYEKFRTCIRQFYAALKGDNHIRFLAITGVTRLKDIAIFSVGSDIQDLSYNNAYAKLIGFSRAEIKSFYLDYLKLGVAYENGKTPDAVTDSEIENLIDRMAEQYDGYCFDEFNANKVFSTYSINSFLKDIYEKKTVRFGDYWYDVGGLPTILMNYLKSHTLDLTKFQSSEIEVSYNDFVNPTSLLDINENVLMCQTGYLTLKSEISRPFRIKLGPANREVASALSSLLCENFLNPDAVASYYDAEDILQNRSAEEIISHLNSILASIPYDKYPVDNEPTLRALILMYLTGLKIDVRAEQNNAKGRSDILINFTRRRLILELKFSQSGKDADRLLKDAVEQIEAKEYGIETLGNREILKIACVFDASKTQRKIVKAQVVT